MERDLFHGNQQRHHRLRIAAGEVEASGLTMNDAIADQLIQRGDSIAALTKRFPSKIAACEYFATHISNSFAAPDPNCAACGRSTDTPPLNFTWRAHLNTAKTVLI